MKSYIVLLTVASCLFFAACHKTSMPGHTDGLGGTRNWHVYDHYVVHRTITADSAVYLDTTYPGTDQSFALMVLGGDTLMLHNNKYYFSHNTGGYYYFPIANNNLSGNKSMITYNRDSNSVRINEITNSVSFNMDRWYYSF